MSDEDIILFPPEDIGLCKCDNSEDLGQWASMVSVCLRCEQDNCPVYQDLRKWADKQEEAQK
jgi:hypothetical protein